MTRCFDTYVMVDWSAVSRPARGSNSIWICIYRSGHSDEPTLVNPSTRSAAREVLERALIDELGAGRRVLFGCDFSYGYPAGFAAALGIESVTPWRAIWQLLTSRIADERNNENNRWAVASSINARVSPGPGPFWMCPPRHATETLTVKKDVAFPFGADTQRALAEFRITERRLNNRGYRVQSEWQLLGAGSVGSQALLGIPVIESLRHHPVLADVSEVWPFETGLSIQSEPGPRVVHAEIWPGAIPIDTNLHKVKDAAQVLGLARHFEALDRAGNLAAAFAPDVESKDMETVTSEEGWILGC